MNHVVWTQWDDMVAPEGITVLGPATAPPGSPALADVTFYVPTYMSGAAGLSQLEHMPNLQYLQMPNAGYDDALLHRRDGLAICNAQGVHDISTAELALALTLASLRGLDEFARAQPDGQWLQATRPALAYKRVGLIGFGSIGQTIARLLKPFQVDLVAFSRSGRDGSHTMDELDGALLVNVARGVVVDTDALISELETGRIKAAIDVMVPEPLPPEHPLWRAPGVLISPHVGGNSSAFEPGMRALLAQQFNRLIVGDRPLYIVAEGKGE